MPTTVLGKRTRCVATADDITITTRSKRRITRNEPCEENENPFVRSKCLRTTGKDADLDTRGLLAKTTRSPSRAAALAHTETSPLKAGAHFRVTKSVIGVYQDEKNDQENVPPRTPRHRDALSKKVPVTPRHRVLVAGNHVSPRTPKTPFSTSAAGTSIYNQARQLFSRCSAPGKLIGRELERSELSTFIEQSIASEAAGCLYVSGPPGTGKSTLLNEVIDEQMAQHSNVSVSVVNCMSVRNTTDLSQKLSEDLDLPQDMSVDHLRSCFIRGKARDGKKYLVVLDEVDRLVDLDLELLYGLFEWSMQSTSRLILIGIANALDLTDRFLPRLKSRDLKPELLPFMPYTAEQIAGVITSKLKDLSSGDIPMIPILQPAAIQFCAKKVAAQTGDLRKAFDICRRAVDLIDRETREKDAQMVSESSPSKTPLMENINLSSSPSQRSPSKSQLPRIYTLETAPKATIAHMAKVTAQAFSNGATQRLGSLNIQQKAVLCALAALEKRKRESQVERTMFSTPSKSTNHSAPSIKQLFEAYTSLCKRDNLFHPLSIVEFRDVIAGLETLSLLSAIDGRNGSFAAPATPSRTPGRKPKGAFGGAPIGDARRVASAVGMKELSAALEGPGGDIMKAILDGDGLQ